jgi:hypothetical protein
VNTLFDDASPGAAAPHDASRPSTEEREVVKCASCGGAILKSVALFVEVNPLGEWTARGLAGVCCRQKACLRAVAEDLAEEWSL